LTEATIKIIGSGKRNCISIENTGRLATGDMVEGVERAVHTVAQVFVDPLSRIAERIGVEPIPEPLPDGVYISSADGKRMYDWPAVVDALVARVVASNPSDGGAA